jgi:hypothetical protein
MTIDDERTRLAGQHDDQVARARCTVYSTTWWCCASYWCLVVGAAKLLRWSYGARGRHCKLENRHVLASSAGHDATHSLLAYCYSRLRNETMD